MALGRKQAVDRKGSKNKRQSALNQAAEVAAQATLNGLTPLDFMLSIIRDPGLDLRFRAETAKAAAPYNMHPKLAPVDPATKPTDPYAGKTTQELNAMFMAELAKRGLMLVDIPEEPQEPVGIANKSTNGKGGGNGGDTALAC